MLEKRRVRMSFSCFLVSAMARPRIAGTDSSSGPNEPASSRKPSALLNTPRLMAIMWLAG